MKMRISVVIPAYNEEKRIGHCLKSVMSQTTPPFEVIVVDNNSSDETAKIAREEGAIVVTEKHQGVTFARNTGFNLARGEIIARTDADTLVPSNWLETISNYFEKDKSIDAISGPAVFGFNVFSPIVKILVFDINRRIFGHYGLYGPNFAIRKSAWERVKDEICLDDDKVHEDTDLSIHIGKEGKIAFVKNLKVKTSARRVRHNPQSQFLDYLVKWADMIAYHKKYRITSFASNIKQRINS